MRTQLALALSVVVKDVVLEGLHRLKLPSARSALELFEFCVRALHVLPSFHEGRKLEVAVQALLQNCGSEMRAW